MTIDRSKIYSGNILIVDDVPDNLRILSSSLLERGYQVRCAKNAAMALLTVAKEPPDLILLDIKMPEMNGYEVCQRLKADPQTKDIPIIFLSALDDPFDKVNAFQIGGADYITKPFQFDEVLVRIQHQIELRAAKAEIAELNANLEDKVRARTAKLEQAINRLNQEIAEHKQTKQLLIYNALHDALTGLPNYALLMEHLQKALERAQRSKNYLFAVLFIDLDRFKNINDSWGHTIGNQVLVAISNLLKKSARSVDTVARASGDEFAILLEDLKNHNDVIAIADRILNKLSSPIELEDRTIFTGASIGIVFGNRTYQDAVELLRDADIAMYRAKSLGRGRYAIFDVEMYAQALHLSQVETDLRFALERQEFVLHYQPLISLESGRLDGFEALIRWQHPKKGLVYPGDFMAIAEETGLIVSIGEWVLREACQQLRVWQLEIPSAASIYISVNLSNCQIEQSNLALKVAEVLQQTNLNPESLVLEITETMLMKDSDKTMALLSQLKKQNIKLVIDDFGTGYSSLSYLHRFPIDALKIDRSFVNLMGANGENSEIVKTIIALARSLGIKAIAEGVEAPHHLTNLRALGCHAAQGYLFSKPVNSELARSLLATNLVW